jgi:hypothetical protein
MGPERQSNGQRQEEDCTIAGFGFSNDKSTMMRLKLLRNISGPEALRLLAEPL